MGGLEATERTRKIIRRAAVFYISGIVLILFTHAARARRPGIPNPFLSFILGVLPNFSAGFSLPFLAIALEVSRPKLKALLPKNRTRFEVYLGATIAALLLWEAVQQWVWKFPFDPNDILATMVGGFLSLIFYLIFMHRIYAKDSGVMTD